MKVFFSLIPMKIYIILSIMNNCQIILAKRRECIDNKRQKSVNERKRKGNDV